MNQNDPWNDADVALLDKLWNNDVKTASECAEVLGKTRNAVIGKVHRLKFRKRRTKKQKSVGWSAAARDAARIRREALARQKRMAERLPPPIYRDKRGKPLPVKPVNDSALVASWLARNGGPRRFDQGASGDPSMMVLWLRERGYQTLYSQAGRGTMKLTFPDGRKSTMTLKRLVEFVDELRLAEGLEPVLVGKREAPAQAQNATRPPVVHAINTYHSLSPEMA